MREFFSRAELLSALEEQRKGGLFTHVTMRDADLSDMDFSGMDCSWWELYNCDLSGCDFSGASIAHGRFESCSFKNARFVNADLTGADLRGADLTGADIRGAQLLCAWLEKAKLEGILHDEATRHFRMRCPETGAFIGYKKGYENRMIMLLIPADAKRTCGTSDACRCSKAKVLTITSEDFTERYSWANSYVDENFIYREGEWAIPDKFTEDRWVESTHGIHFWMTREEAIRY
ncbi:MAG: pentapeptide repeat-containing protein [Clostridia bacterium]|nr:pentapeptide repeat-containing protein [Clostridia bacterium]MBQ4611344.1 pentapeptide repeat-containing protein [Clostridia bacterium]MBQ6704299.1 pentapeptide repeat-containing protein [Clostridia bacterium]